MRGKKEHGENRYIDNGEKSEGICSIQLFAARGVISWVVCAACKGKRGVRANFRLGASAPDSGE